MSNRYILVIADGSKEMEVALHYACARAKKTDRKIIIATFIEPLDVLTTQGVSENAQTGPATVIIAGFALGMQSTLVPVLVVSLGVFISFELYVKCQRMDVGSNDGSLFNSWDHYNGPASMPYLHPGSEPAGVADSPVRQQGHRRIVGPGSGQGHGRKGFARTTGHE
mgnify:CR=1 FL=1